MDGINNNYTRAFTITIVNEIILNQSQLDTLTEHALKSGQNESCAMLLGNETDENWTVKEIVLTENTTKSEVMFTISPDKEFEVDQKAKESNMEIVCIFHSHPESEAQPSETDKKFMRVNPFPWIIYSGKTKEMNCFILQDENVKQISII